MTASRSEPPVRLRLSLAITSLATAVVACWLFFVIASVLPGRDSSHLPTWRIVALGFLCFSGLSWLLLGRGLRRRALCWAVRSLAVVAIGFGLSCVVEMVRHSSRGGHFEGYIVLMGVILCAHGASAVLYSFSSVPASTSSSPASRW